MVGEGEAGVVDDDGGLSVGDEGLPGEDGVDVLSMVNTSNPMVPIPGRSIAALSRWHPAELISGGQLREPISCMVPLASLPSRSMDPYL